MHGEATPVVGLTTHGDVEQRARQAAEAGQQAHLSIPVAKATLVMCVQKVLQHHPCLEHLVPGHGGLVLTWVMPVSTKPMLIMFFLAACALALPQCKRHISP